jgi:hypothetical protein
MSAELWIAATAAALASTVATLMWLRYKTMINIAAALLVRTQTQAHKIEVLKQIVQAHGCVPTELAAPGETRTCPTCETVWEAGEASVKWNEQNIYASRTMMNWSLSAENTTTL